MRKLVDIRSMVVVLGLLLAGCQARGPRPIAVTPIPSIDATTRQLRVFDAAWAAVDEQYVNADFSGVDWAGLGSQYRGRVAAGLSEADFVAAMNAMLARLPDDQAVYETRAQRLEAETADRRTYHGIGAFISFRAAPEPHVIILAVIKDSPAEKAGLQPHDSIYAVDGQPFTAADAAVPAARVRGAPGSQVVLSVQTPGQARREVQLMREAIYAEDVLRGGYLNPQGVAVFRVPVAAERSLAQDIAENLASMAQRGPVNGIIVDLRVARSGNGSWPLTDMLTLFGNGDLGEFYTRTDSSPLSVAGADLAGSQTAPLTILVGPDTQGSPEIFAAALQSAGRATVVGLPTHGTVEGFTEVPLPDGSRLFLATSSFRTPNNVDLATSGIVPDVQVTADWDEITGETDSPLQSALTLLGSN